MEVFQNLPVLVPMFIVVLAGIFMIHVIYCVYFHPLAQVPGPFFAKISGLPRIWHCRNGDRHLWEMEAHQKYGKVIRIAPSAITFSTMSALQTIHTKDSPSFKGDEFYGLLDGGSEGGRSIQMTASNEAHATRRRVLDKALPHREQAFRVINDLAKLFASTAFASGDERGGSGTDWTKAVDFNQIATWFSFDLISAIAFGKTFDMLRVENYRWVPASLKTASIFLYWGGYSRFLGFWQWLLGTDLPSRLRIQTVREAQKYAHLADITFHERKDRLDDDKDSGSKRSDIFRYLLDSKLYSDSDLRADSSLLIAAGSDAIRLTVAATLFYWMKNPSVYEKAMSEIRSSVSSSNDVTDSILSSLSYLRACVDETLRMCPPKAASLPREVKDSGIMVDRIGISKGATVGISVYALHHDEGIYQDPYSYVPERWLVVNPDRRMHAAFCPFLKGPRACPGKTIAYLGIQLALFHLVYRFDVRSSREGISGGGHSGLHRLRRREDEYQFQDWILGYADGPVLELKKRVFD